MLFVKPVLRWNYQYRVWVLQNFHSFLEIPQPVRLWPPPLLHPPASYRVSHLKVSV